MNRQELGRLWRRRTARTVGLKMVVRASLVEFIVVSAGFSVPTTAMAQVSAGAETTHGSPGNLQPIDPELGSPVFYDCAGIPVGPFGTFTLHYTGSSGNSTTDAIWGFNLNDTYPEIATTVAGMAIGGPPLLIQPCAPMVVQDFGHLTGSINLYTFAAGGGMYGGFRWIQRASASISMEDTLCVYSTSSQAVELPIHVNASVTAGESFGDPENTYAKALIEVRGSFAGVPIEHVLEIESVTVIPEQASILGDEVVQVFVDPGYNYFPISLLGSVEAEASAQSVGLWGLVSGAATVGVSLPNSIGFGPLRGAGGSDLPPGIEVTSLNGGFVYCSSFAHEDVDMDGDVDLDDYAELHACLSGPRSPVAIDHGQDSDVKPSVPAACVTFPGRPSIQRHAECVWADRDADDDIDLQDFAVFEEAFTGH